MIKYSGKELIENYILGEFILKINFEKKYFKWGLTVFLTALAILCVVFFFWKNDSIKSGLDTFNAAFAPLFYGLIIAYLLCPIMNWIEEKCMIPLFGKLHWFEEGKDPKRKKHIRVFSVAATFVIVLALLYFFFASVIPEVISSIKNIVAHYPVYTKNLTDWFNKILKKYPDLQGITNQLVSSYTSETDDWLNDSLLPAITKLIPNIGDVLLSFSSSIIKFGKFLFNFLVGLMISIFVLNSKEKFGSFCVKLCYAFMERPTANRFIESVRFVHRTFIGFLSGKVVDSFIIGCLSFIVLTLMRMPYTILISIIIGVTNIIPFFGPIFGAIPSTIILLMVDPKLALYFLIFVVILQQFDGNILGPIILSQTTGVTTFWIIVSITVFSGFFGVPGMIIAVPVTAVIFSFVNKITDNKLIKKELPVEAEKYFEVGEITEEGVFTHYEPPVKPVKEKKGPSKFGLLMKKLWGKAVRVFKKKD